MIELKLYRSFAQTRPHDNVNNYVSKDETPGPEGEYSPPPLPPHSPSLTQHRLIRNFHTIELMETLKITVLVQVRRSQAEDIEWGNDFAWCGDLTQTQMATILELPLR